MNSKFLHTIRATLCAIGLLMTVCATAQQAQEAQRASESGGVNAGPAAGIAWQKLSPEQQKLLAGMQDQWSHLPSGRQVALATGAQRFIKMDGAQREQAKGRFQQWNAMPESDRVAVAQQFAEFRRLPPEDKARLRQALRRFDKMTPEQRQRLRQRFQSLSSEERVRAREQLRNRPNRPR